MSSTSTSFSGPRRRRCRIVNETLDAALLRGDFIGEELKGDRTAELSVLGLIHLAHTARTDLRDDTIMGNSSAGGKFSHVQDVLRQSARRRKKENPERLP